MTTEEKTTEQVSVRGVGVFVREVGPAFPPDPSTAAEHLARAVEEMAVCLLAKEDSLAGKSLISQRVARRAALRRVRFHIDAARGIVAEKTAPSPDPTDGTGISETAEERARDMKSLARAFSIISLPASVGAVLEALADSCGRVDLNISVSEAVLRIERRLARLPDPSEGRARDMKSPTDADFLLPLLAKLREQDGTGISETAEERET